MNRYAWIVAALVLASAGCAQNASKGTAGGGVNQRLQSLEADFSAFQAEQRRADEERKARDADIDAKLRDIAARLGPGQRPAAQPGSAAGKVKGRKTASEPTRAATPPVVAGQVIPYSQLVSAQPGPRSQAASQTPAGRTSQPVAPSQSAAPAPAATPAGQSSLPAIKPPVVELAQPPLPAQAALPPARQTRQPAPYDSGPSGRKTAPAKAAPAERAAVPECAAQAQGAPQSQSEANLEEERLYTEAMRAVTASKNEEGRRRFNELMAKFPNSPKTPLAMFWIGESFMADKSYNQAILSFKDEIGRYPKHFKTPEAIYKTGEAYERLGDKANATFNYKLLVDEHPDSDLVGKAKQKLKQLGQ